MSTIGFIGIGIMGRGMALNLIKGGNKLVVWNRTASKCTELVEAGAVLASSPSEVIKSCDTTYSMLSTPEVSSEVFYSKDGTLAGVSPGKRLVDCATLNPATMQKFASDVEAKGGQFLEAPVSGSKGPAADGTLIFMCAGDKAVFDEILPTGLELMGKKSLFVGEVGQASKMKLGVNMVMGQMMVALSEGIALTEAAGLDAAEFVDVLSNGAMACGLIKGKGANITGAGNYAPQFPLKHQQKDVRLACELGKELGVSMPQAEECNKTFTKARPSLDDEDFCAVVKVVRKN